MAIRVNLPTGTKWIGFSYDRRALGRRLTLAKILDSLGQKEGYLVGVAECVPPDPFSREVGRKLALGRALAFLPRPMRKYFWEAYFGRKASSSSLGGQGAPLGGRNSPSPLKKEVVRSADDKTLGG